MLGTCALERDRRSEAVPLITESLRFFSDVDFRDFLASSLVALARTYGPDDAGRAAELLGAARTIRSPLGPAQFPWEQPWFDGTRARVRSVLGTETAEARVDAGASNPEQTIADALATSR